MQDIFEDLQDPGPVPAEGDNAYKVAIRKLDFYFRVEENIPYERHVFRQLSLQEGETADQFMVRLRKQARHCNFGTSLNDNLRDQLIEKLTDFELKRKLLEQRNITLEEALDKARAWEAAGRQATNMTMNPVVVDSVNAVKTKEEKRDDKRKSVLYLNQAAQPHRQRLEVSWEWSALVQVLFPTLPQLQSLYEGSPGRELPLYGAVSRKCCFRN